MKILLIKLLFVLHTVLAAIRNICFIQNCDLDCQKRRFRLPKSTCWQSRMFNLCSSSSFWQFKTPFFSYIELLFTKSVVYDCRVYGVIYVDALLNCKVVALYMFFSLSSNSQNWFYTERQENMSVKCISPHTPLFYNKNGIHKGISIFLIFHPKHRLWVLVRTASLR